VAKFNTDGSALIYSTFLGGRSDELGEAIAVDDGGNAYITGYTISPDFPTINAVQSTAGGAGESFLTKLNADGSALIYSSYLGGSGYDEGFGVSVDSMGHAYVSGRTTSTNFPVKNAFQPAFGGGDVQMMGSDAFVAKFDSSGAMLVYSTYLGGSDLDEAYAIAADKAGSAYVTGRTYSLDFPTQNALQVALGGYLDAFVTKLAPNGSLAYSTYLGGNDGELGFGIAVNGFGDAYVSGATEGPGFPTVNPLQPTYGGGNSDAFLAKLDAQGSALVYSTYLGGSGYEGAYDVAVDSAGNT
jgi:hypothetical protein